MVYHYQGFKVANYKYSPYWNRIGPNTRLYFFFLQIHLKKNGVIFYSGSRLLDVNNTPAKLGGAKYV